MILPKHIRRKQGGFWGEIIAAVASAASAYMSNRSQKKTNKANQRQAEEQRQFGAEQTGTAYQRGVLDMQAAGLNPMLAYSQGGAQSAGSSQAVMQPEYKAEQGSSSAQAAMGVLQGIQQIKNGEVSADQAVAQTDKIKSETLSRDLHSAKLVADIEQARETAKNQSASSRNFQEQTGLLGEQILKTRFEGMHSAATYWAMKEGDDKKGGSAFMADARRRKAEASLSELEIPKSENEAKYQRQMGEINPYLNTILKVLGGANSARNAIGR